VIEIADGIFAGEDELFFRASRSGGPGGQNVNKVNTRVTLFFDVANCRGLSQVQKRRILSRLQSRADKNGVLRVVSQKFRTQKANRGAAIERLQELLRKALSKPRVRRRTTVPHSAVERRLEQKRHRSLLKRQRAKRLAGDLMD
jgi:ribosome-associated protein